MPRLKAGDRVTLARGKKRHTDYTPGEADLAGVQAVVCDEPLDRVGSIDGKTKGRITVRPMLPSTGSGPRFGMPLDVPVDSLRRETKKGYFAELAGAVKSVGIALVGGWPDTKSDEWNRPGLHFDEE